MNTPYICDNNCPLRVKVHTCLYTMATIVMSEFMVLLLFPSSTMRMFHLLLIVVCMTLYVATGVLFCVIFHSICGITLPGVQGLEASCQRSATTFSLADYLSWLKQLHCAYSYDLEEKLSVLQSVQYTSECMGHMCSVWGREVAEGRGVFYLCKK